jgi:hypothetical protein
MSTPLLLLFLSILGIIFAVKAFINHLKNPEDGIYRVISYFIALILVATSMSLIILLLTHRY